MTPHDLLANFEVLAEAPNGIQRLRELVLELAVRGKLVEQDPGDEPANELLKRIKADKGNLILSKKIRAGKALPSIGEDEIPFQVPTSWIWARLGDIGDWGAGATPTRGNSAFYGGGINWFKSGELNDGSLVGPSAETITAVALSKFSLRENLPGDVLIALYGATIGKLAVLGSHGTTNQAICACTCFADAYNLYLFLFLMAWRRRFTAQGEGGAQPNISKEKVVATPFPLPPLPEQRRIVARVDELMALLDRLEAKRQEREAARAATRDSALAALRDAPTPEEVEAAWLRIQERFHELFAAPEDVEPLWQTLLQLGIQGKLVPQDLSDEPAEELLRCIAVNKARLQSTGQIGKDKSTASVGQTKGSFQIPESWCWAKLEVLTELITKGSSPKWQGISYVSESEGVLFITSENVGNYKLRKLADLKYVESRFNEIEPRSVLNHGDILINLVGASIGRSAKYSMNDGANINQAVALIRLVRGNEGVCPDFLLHFLNSPPAIDYMLGSRVVNAQPNISLTDAREFLVPVPPFAEQRRIVEKVDELMGALDYLLESLDSQQSLASAFSAGAIHHLDI